MIVWTETTIYIAREEILIDTIPLHEIECINEMNEEVNTGNKNKSNIMNKKSPTMHDEDDDQAMKIRKARSKGRSVLLYLKTIQEGFNAGRSYYIKATINNSSDSISAKLNAAAYTAKQRVYRKSLYQKSQEAAKALHKSFLFQMCVASFILLVIYFA